LSKFRKKGEGRPKDESSTSQLDHLRFALRIRVRNTAMIARIPVIKKAIEYPN